jgi:hypothetical protein
VINLKNIVISGKEVCPIIEGGKGINGSDGRSSGHFAKEGCVGTISLVSADYYDENGYLDERKVINAVKEIDEKLKTETDGKKRTQLMFEQMLRGLYLTQVQGYL